MEQPTGKRVLVVEDTPRWQRDLRAELEAIGCVCQVVASYEAALAQLESAPFDLGVFDVNLGNERNNDGIRLAQWLAEQQRGMPVILITADDSWRDTNLKGRQYAFVKGLLHKGDEWSPAQFQLLTCKYLNLPQPERRIAPPRRSAKSVTETVPSNGQHILVVEDQAWWQKDLRHILERDGYTVSLVATYAEALSELLNTVKLCLFDVTVVDLKLAGNIMHSFDGVKLLDNLKGLRVPTIVISGFATPAHFHDAKVKYDVYACFDKVNFKASTFLQAVHDAIDADSRDANLQKLLPMERLIVNALCEGVCTTDRELVELLKIKARIVKEAITGGQSNGALDDADIDKRARHRVRDHIHQIMKKLDFPGEKDRAKIAPYVYRARGVWRSLP